MHGLVDHALAREGRVTVQQDGHGLLALGVTAVELFRAHLALHHGIHSLQMGRVGDHRQSTRF